MTRVVICAYRVAALSRAAGHFWVYAQYADALRRIGCDVWWLEELPARKDPATTAARAATLVDRLAALGLSEKLILFRLPTDAVSEGDSCEPTFLNVPGQVAEQVIRDADLLLNFHYALPKSLLSRFRRTALVDIDPGMLQLWWQLDQLPIGAHDAYFTIGENVGAQPPVDRWIHTPPAVSLDLWPFHYDASCAAFTTVSSWSNPTYVVFADGTVLDTSKRIAYLALVDLPRHTGQRLELTLALDDDHDRDGHDRRLLERAGWTVRDALDVAATPETYRSYIQGSRGEFACAKPAYQSLGNAWLSDRTVCYLASGKPAVVQHTGNSGYLPEALGLFRFCSADDAVAALESINSDYRLHCEAAREIAETHFSATRLVRRMLQQALPS